MGQEGSKPIPFNQMSAAELQKVRRRSLSDNNLTVAKAAPRSTKPRFRRTLSLNKSAKKRPRETAARPPRAEHVAARDLEHAQNQGYLEKCHMGGSWQSVWCVLRGGTLYVFASPIDECALDTVLLNQCTFRQYTEGFKDRPHVVEIRQKPYSAEYIAMDTREDMAVWLGYLKAAVLEASVDLTTHLLANATVDSDQAAPLTYTSVDSSVLPSSEWDEVYNNRDRTQENSLDGHMVLSPDSAQRELILEKKQRLLQEVLQQKQQLQDRADKTDCKDAEDDLFRPQSQNSTQLDLSPRSPAIDPSPSPRHQGARDEQQWKELTLLKQRKMSTELKVDSLRRILDSCEAKHQKKPKLRMPKDLKRLKKSCSQENLCAADDQGHRAEELQHWVSQLQTLRNELGALTTEIEEREQRHTWYQGISRDTKRTPPTDSRSISLLSEKGLIRHNLSGNIRKPSSSSVKSDGCFDDDRSSSRRSDGNQSTKSGYKTWEPRTRLNAQNSNNSIGDGKSRLKSQNSNSSTGEFKSILKTQQSGGESGNHNSPVSQTTSPKENNVTATTPHKTRLAARSSNSSVSTTTSAASTAPQNTSLDSKSESGSMKNLSRISGTESPRSRTSRLQKITALGKKLPSLPSLKRGIFRKNVQDKDDATSPILANSDRRSSYDIVQACPPPFDCHKRASLDERLVLACRDSKDTQTSPTIHEEAAVPRLLSPIDLEVFQTVPPNSRRSSDGEVTSSNVSSPTTPGFHKADSLLSSVMQALHTISTDPDQQASLDPRSGTEIHSSQNNEMGVNQSQTPNHAAAMAKKTTSKTSTHLSADSNHSVSVFADGDSGHGSPLTPDNQIPHDFRSSSGSHQFARRSQSAGCPGSCKDTSASPGSTKERAPSHRDRSWSSVSDPMEGSCGLQINPRALANIAAFEALIQEKLRYF